MSVFGQMQMIGSLIMLLLLAWPSTLISEVEGTPEPLPLPLPLAAPGPTPTFGCQSLHNQPKGWCGVWVTTDPKPYYEVGLAGDAGGYKFKCGGYDSPAYWCCKAEFKPDGFDGSYVYVAHKIEFASVKNSCTQVSATGMTAPL
ncbi:hypothetical protein PGT21_031835 [Puccinia graminis f. sp. tritici]|uniref:Uncharacterized protein n=1 Tax=Puccinia graminis f. sp. tritici TaxID=56615 RepID=A0A5B0QCE1_PUCGR|nr:hypothetical protein PGT21_031835 [Puccinia graminis f. sp. tritici]